MLPPPKADSHLPLTFRHRAGVRPYTSSLDLAEPCVFDKQSPGPLHCGPPAPEGYGGRPFSRSYGSILPSSLAMNLSSALEYSSQPPVSVYGTGRTSRFSWKSIRWIITLAVASVYYRAVTCPFNVQFRLHAPTSRLRRFWRCAGTEILIRCPSTAPFGFALGPD